MKAESPSEHPLAYRAAGLGAFLLVWQVVSVAGIITPLILPSPLHTAAALVSNGRALAMDLAASVTRLLIGFLAGALLGILIGTVLGANRRFLEASELVIDFFRSLPVITLYPLTMILFGLGDTSKVALTAWTVFLLTAVNTIYGIRQVPRTRILAAVIWGASKWQLVMRILIPSAMPTIVAGLRLAISLGLVVVIVTEMLTGTNHGLGKRIYETGLIYDAPAMYAAIIVSGLLGYGLNKIIVVAEGRMVHWTGQ